MTIKRSLIFILSLIAVPLLEAKKHIFWDLGNTLLKASSSAYVKHLGISGCLKLSSKSPNPQSFIIHNVCDALLPFGAQQGDHEELVCMPGGRVAAQSFVDFQLGRCSYEAFEEQLRTGLETLYTEGVIHEKDYKLLACLIDCMFAPDILSEAMRPIKKAIKLLEKCASCSDCELYIISNYDPEGFKKLYEMGHNQPVFKHFDSQNIIVSGYVGLIKPHKDIFTYALSCYNLDAADCILIDDQPENCAAAERCGFTSILCTSANYTEIEQTLRELGALTI